MDDSIKKQKLDLIESIYGEDLADAISEAIDLFEGIGDEHMFWSVEDFVRAAMFAMPTQWLQSAIKQIKEARKENN